MPYARLVHHAVWATKPRQPVIVEGMIAPIQQSIRETSRDLGVTIFAVGVMPDHVHVLAQIPPALTVSRVIGRWKGAASYAANLHRPSAEAVLVWQGGYGVLSVSQHGFDRVLE